MADFLERIEGLTGISISDSTEPTEDEVTQFIKDGIDDVTSRCLILQPVESRQEFARDSGLKVANLLDLSGAEVISVVRADGVTAGNFKPCKRIPVSDQYMVTDTGSLKYASAFNPVFTHDGGKISVYPAPSDNSGKDSFKVYYVNHDHDYITHPCIDTILYFPKHKVPLVMMYASIKVLNHSLSSIDISTFSFSEPAPISIPTPPDISGISVEDVRIDSLPAAPVYTAPQSMQSTTMAQIDAISGEATPLGTDADFDDPSTWWHVMGEYIEDEEDIELAQAQMQKMQTYLAAYKVDMENSLQEFNEDKVEFQAEIQRSIEQARITMQKAQKDADLTLQESITEYQNKLQRVSTDFQRYSALINVEVQKYAQELLEKTKDYEWKYGRLRDLRQEYEMIFEKMKPSQPKAPRRAMS